MCEICKKPKNGLAGSRDADGRKRIRKRVLEWKPTGRRNRRRSRKRWIEDIEKDIQIMGIRGGEGCVRKGRNGRKSLRRLKPTMGCNASKRRR